MVCVYGVHQIKVVPGNDAMIDKGGEFRRRRHWDAQIENAVDSRELDLAIQWQSDRAVDVAMYHLCEDRIGHLFNKDVSIDLLYFDCKITGRCSPGSTLKKKKANHPISLGMHTELIGGLTYANTQGLGPTVSQPELYPLSADESWQH
jgi:hypothetical protein